MTKLRKCPFCDERRHISTWKMSYRRTPWTVECMECHAMGPFAKSEKKAIKRWNRRDD